MQGGGYEDPDGWVTDNLANGVSVSKTTDSYTGNFALQVINNYPWFEGPLSGYATSTFSDSQSVSKISAYIKCDSISGNGGTAMITVVGYIGSVQQELGQWDTSVEVAQYTFVELPLSPIGQYDSIGIYIMAIGLRDSFGFNPGFIRLIVDDLSIETLSGISELENNQSIKIVPNPFVNSATLLIDYPTDKYCMVTVYDNVGKLVQTYPGVANSPIHIERNNLPDGIYYFQVHSESDFIGTGKFVLQ